MPSPLGATSEPFMFPASLSPYLSGAAYGQAAKAAATQPTTAEGFIELAKQEEPATTVEPGNVPDVDLANVLCTIPEGDVDTPTLEEDVGIKSEGDSDVSNDELPVTKECEAVVPAPTTPSSPSESGAPIGEMAYHPRVLESYPLTIFMTDIKEPTGQPGSPGGISPGTIMSPASSAVEQVYPQPITTLEDEVETVAMDAALPDIFMKSLAGSCREGAIRCLLDLA